MEITFSRSLPVNEDEIAKMIQALQGVVPDEILLKQIPWIEDPETGAGPTAQAGGRRGAAAGEGL